MPSLQLDELSLDPSELSMGTLKRELTLQQRPNWLLRKLMNSLEAKRMKRKLGWSRPWNKYGLTVFRSHIHDMEEDEAYITYITSIIRNLATDMNEDYREFCEELFADPRLMAFTFYHNNECNDEQYEGLTVSLGRIISEDKTKRDRVDIIFEDRRVDGCVDGRVDRVRVYVNPWFKNVDDQMYVWECICLEGVEREMAQAAYDRSIECYQQWRDQDERQWAHWSTNYIDYFGPRTFIPDGTAFT